MVVLPSSFTGGPRYMQERTQDAMSATIIVLIIVHHVHMQPLKWTEIESSLHERQKPQDRHDIIAIGGFT